MVSEFAPSQDDFELEADSGIKDYEYFDDYLEDILTAKISARSYLKNNGSSWDIYQYGESNKLDSVSIYNFDNSIIQKFRSVFNGKCAYYELDDAMVSFSLYSIMKASEESGYKKFIDLANEMSDYVPIYNDMAGYDLNDGISLIGNARIVLNIRRPTKAEFMNVSISLMLDKPSLAKTCYWYAAISTKHIADNTEWLHERLRKTDENDHFMFTCNRFSPYSILLNDFKSKKKLLKTLVFRCVNIIYEQYSSSLLKYIRNDLNINQKRGLVNRYTVLRKATAMSGRKKDNKLRLMLNEDKKMIDDIKKELKLLEEAKK